MWQLCKIFESLSKMNKKRTKKFGSKNECIRFCLLDVYAERKKIRKMIRIEDCVDFDMEWLEDCTKQIN